MPDKGDPETYSLIGAAMSVHRELGRGFLEAVYQDALALEFKKQEITFENEVQIDILYRGQKLNTSYRADFVCYGNVIVELKALKNLSTNEEAQVINYLKATGYTRALLINFGAQSLQYKRLILTDDY